MTDLLLAERRDHVIDRLSSGYARDVFEVEELERRLALAHAATSPAELDALLVDLVPATTALVPAQQLRIVFGSIERAGPWRVPQHLRARVICGNLELDLREARLAPGVTTLDLHVTMGNIEVTVPPGVAVEVEASSFLGNIDERTEHATGDKTLRIVGQVKLGNLELSTRFRGESKREARARRRARRRWRRALHAPWD